MVENAGRMMPLARIGAGVVAMGLVCLLSLAGCSQPGVESGHAQTPPAAPPQSAFLTALSTHCGSAYRGTLVSTDAADADFAKEELVMFVRDCEPETLRIPFFVGDNRSRTWVLKRTDSGLRLKHDHRHEDGSVDAVTQYGGDTTHEGTATRQEFPADDESKIMFVREGLDASVENTWAMEIRPGKMFAYELRRPDRFFRVEFDLGTPIETPPPAWGAE